MCSSMCETPITSIVSLRVPAFTQTPSMALSSCGMVSVTTVKPLESLLISGFMVIELSLDMATDQALVGGQNSEIFGRFKEPLEVFRQAWTDPRSLLHGVGELGWMGGRQHHFGRAFFLNRQSS